MKYLRTILTAFFLAWVFTPAFVAPAYAQADAVDNTEVSDFGRARLNYSFDQARTITYVVAGIAALSVGIGAFFGKFKWGSFFAILGGLLMIALIVEGINFVIGTDSQEAFTSTTGTVEGEGPIGD